MTKREFLDRLERCLASLDAGERAAMVDFYSEQIDDRIDDGMTEHQAVASLESPEDIAANILAQRADTPDPAAQDGGAPQKPAKPGQAQDQRKGFGHAAGKVLLWICAAIGILILLPVAAGLAAAALCLYLSLWCAVVALGAAALACLLVGLLNVAACIVAPVGGTPALIANLAFSVAAWGAAALLALGTYYFAKLLVMLVVWSPRAIQGRSARKYQAPIPPNAATPRTKEYPSMPMPPMAGDVQPPKRPRRLPAPAAAAILACIAMLVAGATAFGAMVAAGGPEELCAMARSDASARTMMVRGDSVDEIDLSSTGTHGTWLPTVALGISPDNNIWVVANDPLAGGMMRWGSDAVVRPSIEGSALVLRAANESFFSMQTFLGALDGTRSSIYTVQVLVPQEWRGNIACDNPEVSVSANLGMLDYTSVLATVRNPLVMDGSVDIQSAKWVHLADVRAGEVTANSLDVNLVRVEADTISVNEGRVAGIAYLKDIAADRLTLGGRAATLAELDVPSATTVIDPKTEVHAIDEDPVAPDLETVETP